jgi:tellurite resistance protein TehA-like permease
MRMPPADHTPASRRSGWLREELLQLLSLAGTLAGLCITGVALFHSIGRGTVPGTLADDMLAVSALLFLLCTYLIFFALRVAREELAQRLERAVDALFLLALTGMVAAGFVMVYTVL